MLRELYLRDLRQEAYYNEKIIHIWWMNIGCESLWNSNGTHVLPNLINNDSPRIVNRTEQLCLLLTDSVDIVIQREKPLNIIRDNLRSIGIELPQIWIPEKCEGQENYSISELILRDEKLIDRIKAMKKDNGEIILMPYAVTPLEEMIAERTGCKLFGSSSSVTAWINSKINTRSLLKEIGLPVTDGFICHNVEDVKYAVEELRRLPDTKSIVIKEAYGASGKGFFKIDSDKSLQFLLNMLNRKNKVKKYSLIVEKWYDTIMDINYQIFINHLGDVYYIPPKCQILVNGVYIGSNFLNNNVLNTSQKNFIEYSALKIGEKLRERGYYGLASIDAIITKNNKIFPSVEINGRFSLSTYISFIPHIVGKDKLIKAKYYNIRPNITLDEIWERAREYRYIPEKKEGIIIYSFIGGIPSLSNGRLYVLYIAKNHEIQSFLEEKIETILF